VAAAEAPTVLADATPVEVAPAPEPIGTTDGGSLSAADGPPRPAKPAPARR